MLFLASESRGIVWTSYQKSSVCEGERGAPARSMIIMTENTTRSLVGLHSCKPRSQGRDGARGELRIGRKIEHGISEIADG